MKYDKFRLGNAVKVKNNRYKPTGDVDDIWIIEEVDNRRNLATLNLYDSTYVYEFIFNISISKLFVDMECKILNRKLRLKKIKEKLDESI